MGSLLTQVGAADAQTSPNESQPIAVVLEYSAPPACPNEAEFRERAERSSARLRWGTPATDSRAYRVLIEGRSGGFRGQLYEAGKATPRELQVPVCEELVDALSLMVALAADATLAEAPAAPASFESQAVPAAPVVEPAVPVRLESPAPQAPTKPAGRLDPLERGPWPHLVSLGAFALLNAAPDTLFGLALSYEHALQRPLSLRLEARAAQRSARASETYGGAAPMLCLRLERWIAELVGCGGLMLGHLDVKGAEYSGGKQSSYWLAPLLSLKLRGAIGAHVTIELGAELEHAFITRSYTVKSDDSTFQTPALSEVVQLGLGARF